ncbi:MAG: ketoacyl-ACP synthase III [Synergistaceae bacterium]|jgi:3-oxoacyl-[acyl-carrier-protein] synthase-3|nr:ketoacyl-ACP synthase III [Synergistaceae bacterium]
MNVIEGAPGIEAVEYWHPAQGASNDDLAREFGDWDARKAYRVTGVRNRYVGNDRLSDMAAAAAEKLFQAHSVDRSTVDFLVLVTQTGDYLMPATACIVQDKLRLPHTCGAFDVNLGCSGYVYGLSIAKALLTSGAAKRLLLITGEKVAHINKNDRSSRVLFGEAAAATLLSRENIVAEIGGFDLGTDGAGYKNLIVEAGGTALPHSEETARGIVDEAGNVRSRDNLFMDGMEIFNFSMRTGPATIRAALEKNGVSQDQVTLFILHQANKMILETLRARMNIPKERFCIDLEEMGNTSSCTIPIALRNNMEKLGGGDKILLCGFGIGYSWASTVLTWRGKQK